ncbi:MAG TPA: hypothetical protein VF056_01070 [Thermoleophilaceae bacterium]
MWVEERRDGARDAAGVLERTAYTAGMAGPTASTIHAGAGGAPGSGVDHGLYGHESVLKLISYRFGLGDLTLPQSAARKIGRHGAVRARRR